MDEKRFNETFNEEVMNYISTIDFKKSAFNGYDRDDVYSKVKSVIGRAREIAWAQFAQAAPADETAGDAARQAAQTEALAILKQARAEKARMLEEAVGDVDRELLSIRAQLAKEREDMDAEVASRTGELEQLLQDKRHAFETEWEAKQNELQASYDERRGAIEAELETKQQEMDAWRTETEQERHSLAQRLAEEQVHLREQYQAEIDGLSEQRQALQAEIGHLNDTRNRLQQQIEIGQTWLESMQQGLQQAQEQILAAEDTHTDR